MEPSQISYSIKELLGQINAKLDTMSTILNTKADAVYVVGVSGRVSEIEVNGSHRSQDNSKQLLVTDQRLDKLEKETATAEAVQEALRATKSNRNLAIGTIVGLLLQFAGLITVFIFKH